MTVTVRTAIAEDKQWVVTVAAKRMLVDEVGREDFYNEEDCGRLFEFGLTNGIILIAESDGIPVGCISGIFTSNMFNSKLITLQEIFWYVLPQHRQGRAGLLLLNLFCQVGSTTAHDINMSLLDKSPVNLRILERKGFTFKEMAFHLKGKL